MQTDGHSRGLRRTRRASVVMFVRFTLALLVLPVFVGCEGEPSLEIDPTELDFGTEATCKTFLIRNVGSKGFLSWGSDGSDLEYTIETSDAWISLGSTNGKCNVDDTQRCEVCVDRYKLEAGINNGTVTIYSNGGNAFVGIRAEGVTDPQ
jgi:hypothetical protein